MLTNLQKRTLKAMAHARKPLVTVGDKGLTQAVLDEAERTLLDHELIKVRVRAADNEQRGQIIERLCAALTADLVQRVGHVATVFRPHPKKPKIEI